MIQHFFVEYVPRYLNKCSVCAEFWSQMFKYFVIFVVVYKKPEVTVNTKFLIPDVSIQKILTLSQRFFKDFKEKLCDLLSLLIYFSALHVGS